MRRKAHLITPKMHPKHRPLGINHGQTQHQSDLIDKPEGSHQTMWLTFIGENQPREGHVLQQAGYATTTFQDKTFIP